MSRILLIRPPYVFSNLSYSVPVTMPLSIAYLAAALLKGGHQVDVLDAFGEGLGHVGPAYGPGILYRGLSCDAIVDRVRARPDAIGVTAMFSQDWPHLETIIRSLRRRFPDVPIIVGGEHATAAGECVLRSTPEVSCVAAGEGERTIVEYAEHLDGKRPLESVAGIQYLDPEGRLRSNPARPRILELDDIPWPAWGLFDLEPYFAAGEGHGVERGRAMPILATRGCPYRCSFCSSATMWTTRYAMRSVPRVLDEIEHYLERYHAENIDFYDLTAIIRKGWMLDFCRDIRRRGLRFVWQLPSGTRAEPLDAEVLREMADTGCRNMTYAPESGSPKTLSNIRKKISLPRTVGSIRAAVDAGIFVKCNLIIGFPKETRRDILRTLWLAMKFAWLGVHDAGLYAFSPYPGSELYEQLRASGTIRRMDGEYFESLMSFMNMKSRHSYCENIGPWELSLYRVMGMGLFYLLSNLLRPSRILRTVRNYRAGRSDTVFEERLFGWLRRRRLVRGAGDQSSMC